jgi:hypothetical protein
MTWALRLDARRLGEAAAAILIFLGLESCATRTTFRPATTEETSRLLDAWGLYRQAALAKGPMELFYDAQVSRSVLSMSGTLAVRDDPGRTLALRVEGPLGLPLARADWNGVETRIFVAGSHSKDRTLPAGEDLSRELGVPVTPAQLSLLLYGLPDGAAPETAEFAGSRAWFSWQGGALRCDFDPAAGRVETIVSRGARDSVEVRFLEWSSGFPSRIRIKTSRGGGADLTLRSADPSAA